MEICKARELLDLMCRGEDEPLIETLRKRTQKQGLS